MVRLKIKFTTVEEVKEFNSIAEKQNFDIDITCGRQIVDAKSIMGVLSIDLTKDIWVVIHAEEPESRDYLEKISKFLV